MSKFLVAYIYKNNNGIGIARSIIERPRIDIEKFESELERIPNQDQVVIINAVKLKQENICIKLLKKIFKKQIIKLQFNQAKKKEFEL